MTSTIMKAAGIGLIAALAAAAVQMLIVGEISSGVTGGLAGAVAATVTVIGNKKTSD